MSDSGQKFIKRNRPPRVHISYQDPYEANKQVELPFVMGVMADLSGNASEVAKLPMADRKFANVDMDNFDAYMESVQPAVTFRAENRLSDKSGEQMGVKLTFTKMADFEPAAIARQVPALRPCSRRANSSPTCSATWTARSRPRRSCASCCRAPSSCRR